MSVSATDSVYPLTGLDTGTIFHRVRSTLRISVFGVFILAGAQAGVIAARAVVAPSTFDGVVNLGSIVVALISLGIGLILLPSARRPRALTLSVGAEGWTVRYSNGQSVGQAWTDPKFLVGVLRLADKDGRSMEFLIGPKLIPQPQLRYAVIPSQAAASIRTTAAAKGLAVQPYDSDWSALGWIYVRGVAIRPAASAGAKGPALAGDRSVPPS